MLTLRFLVQDGLLQKTYHILNAMSQHHERSPTPQHRANVDNQVGRTLMADV